MPSPQFDQPLVDRIEGKQGWFTNAWYRFVVGLANFSSIESSAILAAVNGGTGSSGTTAWTPADGSGAGLVITKISAKYLVLGTSVLLQADITYPATASGATAAIMAPIAAVGNHVGTCWNGGTLTTARITNKSIVFYTAAGVLATNASISTNNVNFTISYVTA